MRNCGRNWHFRGSAWVAGPGQRWPGFTLGNQSTVAVVLAPSGVGKWVHWVVLAGKGGRCETISPLPRVLH